MLVFTNGTVLMVWDTLQIPEKDQPDPIPDDTAIPAGGDVVGFYPQTYNTDNGQFVVYPDA